MIPLLQKTASKAAYHQPIIPEKKRKNIDRGEPSGTAIDKVSPKKGSPVVVGKELVLREIPISPIAKDVPMPCLEDDDFNLKQLKSEISKTLKRHKFDSPSAKDNNQNVNPTGENGTSSLIHSEVIFSILSDIVLGCFWMIILKFNSTPIKLTSSFMVATEVQSERGEEAKKN